MLVVLQRELVREARRPKATQIRVLASIAGFAICLFLLFAQSGGGADGRRMFFILTFAAFWFCFIQGVRVAAGAIADEKREGTLGLLFLTDLRPSGIVLAKLFAVALPLIQPYLAFVPPLAITALHGGVTGGEILRAVTVVGATLMLSVAAGLCVSSYSRHCEHTGRWTLVVLLTIAGLPLLLVKIGFGLFRFFSPWTGFQSIADAQFQAGPQEFWISLLTLTFGIVALLSGAVFFLPLRWETTAPPAAGKRFSLKTHAPRISPEQRARILDRSPGEWLAVRQGMSWIEQGPFLLLIGTLCAFAAHGPAGPRDSMPFYALIAAIVVLLIRLASQASFPLCNARRSGAVELLLSTPMDPFCLVTGQVVALKKQFTPSLAIVLAGAFFYSIDSSGDAFGGIGQFLVITLFLCTWVGSIGGLGMLVGLLEKSPSVAFFQTVFIGIFVAGFISLVFAPLPLLFLFLIGFTGNRLSSDELAKMLKRPLRFGPSIPPRALPQAG